MDQIAGSLGARKIRWRWIGWGGAVALLAVPFVAMKLTGEMNWGIADFIFVGLLLGTLGGLLELAVRVSPRWDYRAGFALALVGTCLVIWVNVAVGIVGSDDNPNNALFFWALGPTVGCGLAPARRGNVPHDARDGVCTDGRALHRSGGADR